LIIFFSFFDFSLDYTKKTSVIPRRIGAGKVVFIDKK
jgi:hypothetical protein